MFYDEFLMEIKNPLRKNVSAILKYLRSCECLSQQEMAKQLCYPRTTYLRLENGQRDLSFDDWIALQERFQITDQEVRSGFLNRSQDLNLSQKIPDHYTEQRYTKGRLLCLFTHFFKLLHGEMVFEQFCEREKVPPTYFTNLGNALNIRFSLRLFQALIMRGSVKTNEQIQYLARVSLKFKPHLGSHTEELSRHTGLNKLVFWLKHMSELEENHIYQLEDTSATQQKVTVSFFPKDHVDLKLYCHDPILGNFAEQWVSAYIEAMAGTPLLVEKISSFHQHQPKSTLCFSMPATTTFAQKTQNNSNQLL